jgi:hypothetical protein
VLATLLVIIREWGTTLRAGVLLLIVTVPVTLAIVDGNAALLANLTALLFCSTSSCKSRMNPRSALQQPSPATVETHRAFTDTNMEPVTCAGTTCSTAMSVEADSSSEGA